MRRRTIDGDERLGLGPGGECVCPNCGQTVSHTTGVPCFNTLCPKCKTTLIRK